MLKDCSLEVVDALEEGDHAKVKACEDEWRQQARTYWKHQVGQVAQALEKPKKKHRVKARAWIVALDKQLRSTCGVGLIRFLYTEEAWGQEKPELIRVITIVLGQGSDGWCAVNFLCREARLCCLILFDPSHRGWNDTQLALKDCGLWSSALLLILCCNLMHGPWADAKWWRECQEGVQAYQSMTSFKRCELFQGHLALMLRDTGDLDRLAEEDIERTTWEELPDAFKALTTKVSMARWFGLEEGLSSLLPVWHKRLCVQLWLCIQLGLYKDGSLSLFSRKVTLEEAGGGDDDVPKKRDREGGN